ncbi:MAG: hypothetical protein F4018_02210 [Acidobacteria bacterium]|nr:hypothetical protein [Acidobacteriota bacterium]MYK87244.1 hypothetical protein [Acidobacteriota bacterium]
MRLRSTVPAGVVLAFLCSTAPAGAQQRPLVTEDPESIGSGLVLVEAGFDYQKDQHFPVSGLTGHLRSVPRFGVSIGVSSIAEVQIDNVSYDTLSITGRAEAPLSHLLRVSGDRTSSWSDTVVGAKTRLLSEGGRRPGIALRFATKLPNAGNEEGIGLDTMDFYNSLLVGKTIRSLRVVGNVGLGILSDPTRGDRQNDVLTYGISFARAFAEGAEIVGEVNGRANTRPGTPPPGTDSSGYVRFGARFTRGLVRVDAALVAGLTAHDAGLGVTTGLTWVFRALELP